MLKNKQKEESDKDSRIRKKRVQSVQYVSTGKNKQKKIQSTKSKPEKHS